MPIRIVCPACGKALKVEDKLFGRNVRCPNCRSPISIPTADQVTSSSGSGSSSAIRPSTGESHIPDDWLVPNPETRVTQAGPEPESDEYAIAPRAHSELETPPPPPARKRKATSTFVRSRGVEFPDDISPEQLVPPVQSSRPKASRPAASGSGSGWRNHLHWAFLLALLPLAISSVWHGRNVEERLRDTVNRLRDSPNGDAIAGTIESASGLTIDEALAMLPDDRIDGAHLRRDSWMHWGYAALSAFVFAVILTQTFPSDDASPGRLIRSGLLTGTIGIVLLLAVQWVAAFTQGFMLRGRSIVTLLFYVVKFIGFSYRAALDPENGFLLSFMGFTCGVGLCEELCKALPVVLFLRSNPHAGWRAAIAVGLASGIGFGVSEGIMYASDHYNGIAEGMTYLVRFASCVALHAIWAGTVALLMNRNQDYLGGEEFSWESIGYFLLNYLAIAMVLHGLYDTLLKKDYELLALAIAVGSFCWLAWLVRVEGVEE
jgi:RsiW-degrading membrane proteinase PrsW (M82 family)